MVSGIKNWNSQSTAAGTGITFAQQLPNASPVWIVSTAWPKATVTYKDSTGTVRSLTVDFSSSPSSTVAESLWLPDYNASGQWLSTAIGGVTLLNTNASYSVPGVGSYPDWQPGGTNFDNALIQIGEHEVAHGLLLGDQGGVSGDIMSSWIYTASNPGGATNNQDGKASSTITPCDASEVKKQPERPLSE